MSVQPSQNTKAYTHNPRNAQQATTGETSNVEAPQGHYETRKADQANTGSATRAQGQLGNSGSPANNVNPPTLTTGRKDPIITPERRKTLERVKLALSEYASGVPIARE
ncbi:hypothetical protein H1R20_g6409, partial [Candolleomyces eurysporus]